MKTVFVKKEDVQRKWYVVDAEGATLGRLAARIASYLRGKHKPIFTPNIDTGDFIIVINAEKIKLTGKKLTDKVYYWHTGYRGGLKAATPKELLEKAPERLIKDAVWGMLPKNRLGRQLFKKLRVYRGAEHPHSAQKPEKLELK